MLDIATPLLHASQPKVHGFSIHNQCRNVQDMQGTFQEDLPEALGWGKKSLFGGRFCTCFEAFHVVQSGYSRRVLKMDVSANLGGPANPVGAFLSRRPCWPLCVFETFSESFERVGT